MSSIYTLVFAEVAALAFSMYWRSGSGSRSTATRSIGRGSRTIQVDYMRRENLSVKVLDFVQSGGPARTELRTFRWEVSI